MVTSRIPAVIDALVSTLAAALPNAKVIDGPFITVPDGDYLTVGWGPQGETTTASQIEADSGNGIRIETIDVPCYCDSYSGSTVVSTRRTAAFALMGAVETALKGDRTLGGVLTGPGWAQIGQYAEYQEQTDAGLAVGVIFHILIDTTLW